MDGFLTRHHLGKFGGFGRIPLDDARPLAGRREMMDQRAGAVPIRGQQAAYPRLNPRQLCGRPMRQHRADGARVIEPEIQPGVSGLVDDHGEAPQMRVHPFKAKRAAQK